MAVPYSRLGRLYTYSKDTAFDAQENFTTEALAVAVQDDPAPMIESLCGVDATRAAALGLRTAADCRPSTQVALPGGGRLDLVLEIVDGRDRVIGEVWIEVKISAPESGPDQHTYYQRRADQRDHPVWLLTLAPAPLRTTIQNLTWNELYRAARHRDAEHPSWRDLRAFLEEQNVANDALGPISDREAASLEPAHDLLLKVSELVISVHRKLPNLFSEPVASKLGWKAEGALLNFIGGFAFRTTGELTGWGGPLRYGLMAQDGTAYWMVEVHPERASSSTLERGRMMADQAGFGPEWDRPASGPSILVARKRATALETHDAALAWFESRLREVAASGVVETLLGLSRTSLSEPTHIPSGTA